MAWDSIQYLRFSDERQQPCTDLISRLNGDFNTILDLGCGPGNSTQYLFEKYKNATIIGLDSDDNMLEKAREEHKNFNFVKGFAPNDLRNFNQKFDLVFSNACIHWIYNQEELIDKVYEILNDKGVFAVQIPLTDESLFYKILYNLIDKKWTKLKSVNNFHNLNQEGYYNTLIKRFNKVIIWRSDYYHVVSKEMVIEWYKGSGLRPYLALLDEKEQKDFLNDLQMIINKEYSLLDDGNVFLIMPRLFFIAEKS
ncbi:MAG: methyltransferase domain-containing protein [Acutalibacteraceae bacterium]